MPGLTERFRKPSLAPFPQGKDVPRVAAAGRFRTCRFSRDAMHAMVASGSQKRFAPKRPKQSRPK